MTDTPALTTGIRGEITAEVTPEMVPRHLQDTNARVLSTPNLVGLMEGACHASLRPYLGPHQRSVGYEVHVKHLAPAPVGATVRVTTELVEIEGNKLAFHAEAFFGEKKIGDGTIRRAIVEHRAFAEGANTGR